MKGLENVDECMSQETIRYARKLTNPNANFTTIYTDVTGADLPRGCIILGRGNVHWNGHKKGGNGTIAKIICIAGR